MRLLLSLALLAACGTDAALEDPTCETTILTYRNFGEPFLLDWCRGCHASGLVDRQGAPPHANFDDLAAVRANAPLLEFRAASAMPTMPPAAGPSSEERAMFAEWLACGAPE